ncbi:hypothetical protein V6O07_01235 [Arthrospira platensis SPKY2]
MFRTPKNDPLCNKCSLSTGKAVHSYSNVPFNKVLLCIYSEYPSIIEESTGLSLFSDEKRKNGGWFLRKVIEEVFDKDDSFPIELKPFNKYILYGNVIRCNPTDPKGDKKNIKKSDRKSCSNWTKLDLTEIRSTIPIILAGSEAYKMFFDDKGGGIKENRGKILQCPQFSKKNPIIVTVNPVIGSHCLKGEILSYTKKRDGTELPKEVIYPFKYELFDPIYFIIKDFEIAKKYLLEQFQKKMK